MAHIHELYDFTVSFYILHPTDKKLCLHYHRKLETWNQLGGHIELDEQPLESLERELLEEAGLQPTDYTVIETVNQPKTSEILSIPAPFSVVIYDYGDTGHKHIDLPYIVKSKTAILEPKENESKQINWFDISEIKDLHKKGLLQTSTLEICEWVLNNYS